ncbi:MAG: hypothetical protein ACLP7I_12140 [Limisphaerales bacterium]
MIIAQWQADPETPDRMTQHVKPTPFLCRSAVRKFLLEHAGKTRAHKFNRVSEDTLLAINELVRRHCVTIVSQLPSKGKTI